VVIASVSSMELFKREVSKNVHAKGEVEVALVVTMDFINIGLKHIVSVEQGFLRVFLVVLLDKLGELLLVNFLLEVVSGSSQSHGEK